jgi:hypothetical protein
MTSWGCVGNGSLRLYFHLLKTRLRASPEDIDDRLKPAIYITTERDVHKARIALLLLLEPLGEAFSGDFLAFDKIRILFRYRDDSASLSLGIASLYSVFGTATLSELNITNSVAKTKTAGDSTPDPGRNSG